MPMPTREEQNKYQREWLARRRADWLAANGPCVDCGGWERLEIDHVDPATKDPRLKASSGSTVFSWSQVRRDAELAKCVVRCRDCHQAKTNRNHEYGRGETHSKSVLTEDQVREIRRRSVNGESRQAMAREFGIAPGTIGSIRAGRNWAWLDRE